MAGVLMENNLEQLMLAHAVLEGINSNLNDAPETEKVQYLIDESLHYLLMAIDELEGLC